MVIMNTKFTISFILTIGAFVFTLYLFGVTLIAQDKMDPEEYPGCGTTNFVAAIPQEPALNHPGEKIFKDNCKACHRINEKMVGPALAGVTERHDSLWLVSWIKNSSKMIADGDPMAVALFKEYNNVQMTSFTSLTDEDLKNLLAYLKLVSETPAEPMPSTAEVEI
jgi:cytochrome c2